MSDETAETTEKPLEKMTVKALREIAKDIPEITGVHGMKKEELIDAISEAKGVKKEDVKAVKSAKTKSAPKIDATSGDIKKKIKALKSQRAAALESQDKKMAHVFRRRISRLKKKSRKAAAISA